MSVQAAGLQPTSNDAAGFILDMWYVAARLSEVAPNKPLDMSLCGRRLRLQRKAKTDCAAQWIDDPAPARCRVSEDLVWVFVASSPERSEDPGPVPVFGGPRGRVRFMERVIIPAHQDDAVYGLLDPAHTPFVHRSPFWRGNGVLKEKRKAFEPSDLGFTMVPHAPVNSDIYKVIGGAISVRIAFRLPGLRAEYIQNAAHTVLGLTALSPIDERNTVLRQIFYWNSPVLNVARPVARLFARPFLQQDVDVMALRRSNEIHGVKGPLLGDSDRQFLWYLGLKKAWEAAGRRRDAFVNPIEPAVLRWRT